MPPPMTPEQQRLLDTQRVARLATVDERGRPHAVPVCFVLLDGRIYTPIDEKPKRDPARPLRRLSNIEANPHVCLVVDRYDEDWSRLAWLQVRGTAKVVDDPDERGRAIVALRAKYDQYRAMALEARPLIRIDPARVVGWRASPDRLA
jgi:PPOX class probable F420-dependent enzyme